MEKDTKIWKMIREEVFMKEQGFQNEFDKIDEIAEHLVLYSEEDPIGCGRIYPDESESSLWYVGRLAILKRYRACGYGKTLVSMLELQAKDLGAKKMMLSAQTQAVPFYEKCGYDCIGEAYMDEHVPHVRMIKAL